MCLSYFEMLTFIFVLRERVRGACPLRDPRLSQHRAWVIRGATVRDGCSRHDEEDGGPLTTPATGLMRYFGPKGSTLLHSHWEVDGEVGSTFT